MKAKKNIFFRCISFALSAVMLFSLVSVCYAANNSEAAQQAAFDALPEDAVVCYLLGEPVYKYQIDENHRIHPEWAKATGDPDVSPLNNEYTPAAQNGVLGNYYAVTEWDGIHCVKTPYDVSPGTMTVEVTCGHNTSPWN